MASPNANLSFLPWVRQGAAAAIPTVDTLSPAQQAVAELTAALTVNGRGLLASRILAADRCFELTSPGVSAPSP